MAIQDGEAMELNFLYPEALELRCLHKHGL